ncbi:hypothetical protein MFIFM68171_05755 [Madurella fahalii]|uniref:Transcription factor domain-containing protein n=1 Tax=Madurella fahalii TaxID=1157608 RepID=A0ABQ0GCQ7_9PEZI
MGTPDTHLAPNIKVNSKADQECIYPSRNRRVRVNERYIRQLVAENKRLRAQQELQPELPQRPGAVDDEAEADARPSATIDEALSRPDSSHGAALDPQPWFIDLDLPHMPTPINEAADTAFATRFRQVLSDPKDPPCVHLPHIDYAGDDTIMSLAEMQSPWPRPSRARLLMDVALMHASRCFHIVRRSVVLDALETSISDPTWRDPVMTCKLRALFALGELCSSRFVPPGREFPGLSHFAQATKMLNYLGERPTLDFIEIRLLLSLYSFTLNRVYAAYTLAGSALRMAVIMGLHLNIPAAHLVDLPSNPAVDGASSNDFADAGYSAAYAKLAAISMGIVRSIYGRKDRTVTLFHKVQQRLKELKARVQDLPPHLHMNTFVDSNSACHKYDILSMHLTLNQTIILATRPILLYGLRLHFSASPPKPIPHSAKTLIDTCTRCARHSCRILSESWINGSFPALYHDLTQYLFSALTVLAASSLLEHGEGLSDRDGFEESVQLLSQLRDSGNFPAREFHRHAELILAAVKEADERQRSMAAAEETVHVVHARAAAAACGPGHPALHEAGAVTVQAGGAGERDGTMPALGVGVTAETALAEPSLQALMMQPTTGMQFLEPGSSWLDEGNGLYWPEFYFQE